MLTDTLTAYTMKLYTSYNVDTDQVRMRQSSKAEQ